MMPFWPLDWPAHSASARRGSAESAPNAGGDNGSHDSLFGGGEPPLPRPPRGLVLLLTLALHVVVLAVMILVPVFWPEPLVDTDRDYMRVLIYDPPPPPPPPLPKGLPYGGAKTAPRALPTPVRTPPPTEPSLVAPVTPAAPAESPGVASEAFGSPQGSDSGVPEGMEEGVEGGVVGGVPGGVVGGVIGGTGTGPVPVHDFDRPPRILRQTRPAYPQEAFVKKVEGTVVLEIVIDENGRVARARVVQSIPLLDAAALETVRQWVFVPAYRKGKPVASVASAPVSFRIF